MGEQKMQEQNQKLWQEKLCKIKIVEAELMQIHKDWPQAKANLIAKKLLCII